MIMFVCKYFASNAMTYHIFQLCHKIYHFKVHIPFDMEPVMHHSIKQRTLFPFQHLSTLPHHWDACMWNKPRPGFFETSAKSVWFDKIHFTYEICYLLLFVNMKFSKWATVTCFSSEDNIKIMFCLVFNLLRF